jgi:hypothetical protein
VVSTIGTVCTASKTFLRSQFFRSPCDAKDLEKAIVNKAPFESQKDKVYIQKIKASMAIGEHGEPYASSA